MKFIHIDEQQKKRKLMLIGTICSAIATVASPKK